MLSSSNSYTHLMFLSVDSNDGSRFLKYQETLISPAFRQMTNREKPISFEDTKYIISYEILDSWKTLDSLAYFFRQKKPNVVLILCPSNKAHLHELFKIIKEKRQTSTSCFVLIDPAVVNDEDKNTLVEECYSLNLQILEPITSSNREQILRKLNGDVSLIPTERNQIKTLAKSPQKRGEEIRNTLQTNMPIEIIKLIQSYDTGSVDNIGYHPLLPDTERANANKPSIYSDHLPMIGEIKIDNTVLRVGTWNLYIPNMASGFDLKENVKDILLREHRLIGAIKELLSSMDILLLQEVHLSLEKLEKGIGSEWKIDTGEKNSANYIIYNSTTLEKTKRSEQNKTEFVRGKLFPLHEQKILFKFKTGKNSETIVMVNNVHLPHTFHPSPTEEYIRNLFTQDRKYYQNIIIGGDFNACFAPLGKSYLPNNVVSKNFRPETEVQGVSWTDGIVFYVASLDSQYHQPSLMYTIDPATGNKHPNIVPDITLLTDKQKFELEQQRPVLSIASEQTIECKLPKESLIKASIELHLSYNALNKKMIEMREATLIDDAKAESVFIPYEFGNNFLSRNNLDVQQIKDFYILNLLVQAIEKAKNKSCSAKVVTLHQSVNVRNLNTAMPLLNTAAKAFSNENLTELLEGLYTHFRENQNELKKDSFNVSLLFEISARPSLKRLFNLNAKNTYLQQITSIIDKCKTTQNWFRRVFA